MKGKKLIAAVAALILVIAGASFAYAKLSEQNRPAQLQENNTPAEDVDIDSEESAESAAPLIEAPDFTVYDAEGGAVRLSDFRGKPVVVNFWASWCGYCVMEMPDFNDLYNELGGEVHFLMINVTDGRQETVDSARSFIEELGYGFPVYYDTELDAASAYGAYSLPQTMFIDAEGYFIARATGARTAETLRTGIDMIK